MNKNQKIALAVGALVIVAGLATVMGRSQLFQGWFSPFEKVDLYKTTMDGKTKIVSVVTSPVTSIVTSLVPSTVTSLVPSTVTSLVPSTVVSYVTSKLGTSKVASTVTSEVASVVTSKVASTVTSEVASAVTSPVASAVASSLYRDREVDSLRLPVLTKRILESQAARDYEKNPRKFILTKEHKKEIIDLYMEKK